MQNPHASVGCFYCTFILCNRFALSVNSAPCLQCHADVACYFSENKVNHLLLPDKGIHYPFPLPEDAGLVFSNVFVAWLRSKKWRECSDVLTRMRLPNSWINSQFMSSVSVEAHQSLRGVGWGGDNKCKSSNKFRKHGYQLNIWLKSYIVHIVALLHIFSRERWQNQ